MNGLSGEVLATQGLEFELLSFNFGPLALEMGAEAGRGLGLEIAMDV